MEQKAKKINKLIDALDSFQDTLERTELADNPEFRKRMIELTRLRSKLKDQLTATNSNDPEQQESIIGSEEWKKLQRQQTIENIKKVTEALSKKMPVESWIQQVNEMLHKVEVDGKLLSIDEKKRLNDMYKRCQ